MPEEKLHLVMLTEKERLALHKAFQNALALAQIFEVENEEVQISRSIFEKLKIPPQEAPP